MDLFDPNDDSLESLGPFGRMLREGAQLIEQLAAQDSPDALAGAIMELDERGKKAALMVAVLTHKQGTTPSEEFAAWLDRDVG